jgi:hypothetical protein
VITARDSRVVMWPSRTSRSSIRPPRLLMRDPCRRARPARLAMVIALAAVVVSSCGSGGVNPTRSQSFSGLPSRSAASSEAPSGESAGQTATRTPSRSRPPPQTQTTTATQTQTGFPTQTQTATRTQIQTETQVQTQTQTRTAVAIQPPTPTPTATQASAAASGDTSNSPPAWLWWLIGALVLAGAGVTVFLVGRRRRRRAWADNLTARKDEVVWFARKLIPRLGQAPTAQQIAGGWRIESDRIVAIEDRLTTLEAAAVDDVGRSQARSLRDAVRGSRTRLAALDTAEDRDAALNLLRSAAAGLEAALGSVDPSARPLEGETTPH